MLRRTWLLSLAWAGCAEPEPPPAAPAPAARPSWAGGDAYGGSPKPASEAPQPDPVSWAAAAAPGGAALTLRIPPGAKVFTDTVTVRIAESEPGVTAGALDAPAPHAGTPGAAETEHRPRWTRDVALTLPVSGVTGAGRVIVETEHQTCVDDRCWPIRTLRHELFLTR